MFRKTKIVCTLGPAVDSAKKIEDLAAAGMNVARMNCSHGDWDTRKKWFGWVREVAKQRKTHIAILIDLQGPKFRLGTLPEPEIEVHAGQRLSVGTGPGQLPIVQEEVLAALAPNRKVLTGDGDVSFKVTANTGSRIDLLCLTGGFMRSRQGITVMGVSFDVPAMTEKDLEDLRIGAKLGAEYAAISYVKTADDVAFVGRHAEELDKTLQIIAKIEMREAVQNIENIIRVSDGIMVARGDMGLQMPIEDVPLVQKRIISLCRAAGKPVITATQMMESMVHNPRPTRAEATDVANAILDGTDAIMLSGETAFGKYPAEAVNYMDKIAVKTERSSVFAKAVAAHGIERITEATEAVAHAAVEIAHSMHAKAILTFSTSGFSARMVSKFKPRVPILCATYRMRTARQTALIWGVKPFITDEFGATEEMISCGFEAALAQGILKIGDLVVITAGLPVGRPGTTNLVTLLQVHEPEKAR